MAPKASYLDVGLLSPFSRSAKGTPLPAPRTWPELKIPDIHELIVVVSSVAGSGRVRLNAPSSRVSAGLLSRASLLPRAISSEGYLPSGAVRFFEPQLLPQLVGSQFTSTVEVPVEVVVVAVVAWHAVIVTQDVDVDVMTVLEDPPDM